METPRSSSARPGGLRPGGLRPLRLLRVAVLVGAGALVTTVAWLSVQAARHPGTGARQFGKYGPLVPYWLPLIVFFAAGLTAVTYVLWRAMRRVQAGEDLIATQRGRRRPGAEG